MKAISLKRLSEFLLRQSKIGNPKSKMGGDLRYRASHSSSVGLRHGRSSRRKSRG